MTLDEAKYLADTVIAKLVPYTERAIVCGSVRRKKKECKDVDIVVIPRRDPVKDMFGMVIGYDVIPEFVQVVNQWPKVIGSTSGKMTRRIINGHQVELHMASKDNFGIIQAIRTGDGDFSHMLVIRAAKLGFIHQDGCLYNAKEQKLSVPEEDDYFKLLNLPYIQPELRNKDAFRK